MNANKSLNALLSFPSGSYETDEAFWLVIQGHDHPAPAFALEHYIAAHSEGDPDTRLTTDVTAAFAFVDEHLPGTRLTLIRDANNISVDLVCTHNGREFRSDLLQALDAGQTALAIMRAALDLTVTLEHHLNTQNMPVSFVLAEALKGDTPTL